MANYVKSKKTSKAKGIAAFMLIVAILVGGVLTAGYASRDENGAWFKESDFKKWSLTDKTKEDEPVIAVSSDGYALTDGSACATGGGIIYLMRSVNNQEYVPSGEITLSATLENEYINGVFDWSMDWANPDAEWAQGKMSTDYVSITPVAPGSSHAVLHFLAKFNEQILVKTQLRGTGAEGITTVDCIKDVALSKFQFYGTDFTDSLNFGATATCTGNGTVIGNFNIASVSFNITNDFIKAFNNYLTFDVEVNRFTLENIPLTYSGGHISNDSTDVLTYEMCISNFANYDQAHKDAIYYAWFAAYNDVGNNVLLDYEITYSFNGVKVRGYSESDMSGSFISGDGNGSSIEPSVTLNKNVVF